MKGNGSLTLPIFAAASSIRCLDGSQHNHPIQSRYRQEVHYFNGLNQPVIIGFRNGMTFLLPACLDNTRYSNDVIVQVRHHWRTSVKFDVNRIFDVSDDRLSLYRNEMKKAFGVKAVQQNQPNFYRDGTHDMCSYIDYAVSLKDLMKANGQVYVHELDLTVCFADQDVLPHPESTEGRQIKESEKDPLIGKRRGLTYRIEIVDNNSAVGPRFININNSIFRIDPVADIQREEGVYLYQTPEISTGADNSTVAMTRYGFDEADKVLCLHRTADDAKALGDLGAMRENQIAEEKHAQKMREMQLQGELLDTQVKLTKAKDELTARQLEFQRLESEAKIQQTRYTNELDALKQKMEAERTRFEHERDLFQMREKDRLESRSNVRKESAEVIKWIPTFIVGIGAFLAVVMKAGG